MTPSRLIIATPVDGAPQTATVTYGYHVGVRQLERAGAVVLPAELFFADDLARARSRAVWAALRQPNWDWLLWWDDDVIVKDTTIVPRMVEIAEANEYRVIGAPYPRKRIPAQFPYKPLGYVPGSPAVTQTVMNDCIEVEHLAFGFMLTHRIALEAMCMRYSDEWFTDTFTGEPHEVCALFKQVHTEESTIVLPDNGPFEHKAILGHDLLDLGGDPFKNQCYKPHPTDPKLFCVKDRDHAGDHGRKVSHTEWVTWPTASKEMRYRELLSEDYSFCSRYRAMKGRVMMYVGNGAPLSHVGGHVFTGEANQLGRI